MKTKFKLTLTVYRDARFWVALLCREDDDQTSLAKHIFGDEPTDPELYEFVLHELHQLKFSEPEAQAQDVMKRYKKNFKRMQRDVRKSLKSTKLTKETMAQELLRKELEAGAKEKQKKLSRAEREEAKREAFQRKQEKKKQKLKGH